MSRFGDLLSGNSKKQVPEITSDPEIQEEVWVSQDVQEEVWESQAEVSEIQEEGESDLSLDNMTKNELEEYGRTIGIELDRRHSKSSLIEEITQHLNN